MSCSVAFPFFFYFCYYTYFKELNITNMESFKERKKRAFAFDFTDRLLLVQWNLRFHTIVRLD